MRWAFMVACSVLVAACSGAKSTPSSASSAESGEDAAEAGGVCLAAMVPAKPAMPIEEVGTVVVHRNKSGCSIEVRSKDGAEKTAPECEPKGIRKALPLAGCALNGDAMWLSDPASEKAETVEIKVGRYSHPDAKADLDLICAPFGSLKNTRTGEPLNPESFDPSQRATVRAATLEEQMTSRKWRLWLHGFLEHRDASIAELRDAAKAAGIECESEWTSPP